MEVRKTACLSKKLKWEDISIKVEGEVFEIYCLEDRD